jgi:hypothetical protein
MDAHCPGKENYNNKFNYNNKLNFSGLKYRNCIGPLLIAKLHREGKVIYEYMGRNGTLSGNKGKAAPVLN